MAKTTATVTVGADTKPFEKKMKGLGGSLKGVGGAMQKPIGGAMSGIRAGVGGGLAFGAMAMGLAGIGSIIDNMKAISPEFAGAMNKLSVAFQQALLPAALELAGFLTRHMPAIASGLETFGIALGDAIKFWTVDAFNPEVWKDIGSAIAESVRDAIVGATGIPEGAANTIVNGATQGSGAARSIAEGIGFDPDNRLVTAIIDGIAGPSLILWEAIGNGTGLFNTEGAKSV